MGICATSGLPWGWASVDFVVKPVDFDDMRQTIERTLRNLEQWREALSQRDQLVSLRQEAWTLRAGFSSRSSRSISPVLDGYDLDAFVHSAGGGCGGFL